MTTIRARRVATNRPLDTALTRRARRTARVMRIVCNADAPPPAAPRHSPHGDGRFPCGMYDPTCETCADYFHRLAAGGAR